MGIEAVPLIHSGASGVGSDYSRHRSIRRHPLPPFCGSADSKSKRPSNPEGLEASWIARRLVAGYGFGGFFLLGGVAVGIAVAIGMAVAVAVAGAAGWGDADRLARISEVGGDGLGDVAYRADLDYGGLGLLEHQLFVDGPDLGLFLGGLLATGAIFFRGGQGNIVFGG